MRFYKITAPTADYSGQVGGVGFHKGVARATEDEIGTALDYFARKGYDIEVVEETPAKAEVTEQEPKDPDEGPKDEQPPVEEPKPAEPKAPAKPAAKTGR